MSWQPPQNVGDRQADIVDGKKRLAKFSYGKGLGVSDEYTIDFGVALRQFQANVHDLVTWKRRPGPDVNVIGVYDYNTKLQLGVVDRPAETRKRAVGFSVAGHMSNMFDGPAFFTAKQIETEGFCRVQPVGYDNVALPFRNDTGINELDRLFHDEAVLPRGADSFLVAHSQGGIVVGKWWLTKALPNITKWPYSSIKAAVMFGNPYRGTDQVAAWVTTPPKRGTRGISNERIEDPPPWWQEVSNTKDLYAENTDDDSGEHKTAIYRAVQNEWDGPGDSLAEQIKEIVTGGGKELWAVFTAIASGVRGVANLGAHGTFDLRPPIHYIKETLGVV